MLSNRAPESKPTLEHAWSRRAEDLARWVDRWLVNRTDVHGGYWREDNPDGTRGPVRQVTRPARRLRGLRFLSREDLARHFRGEHLTDLVGLHTTSPSNHCRWLVVDLDCHGPDSTAAALNMKAVLGWYARLKALGMEPLLCASNGVGGYHLWQVFSHPTPSWAVYHFGRWLVSDFAQYGLTAPPETFPKQASLQKIPYGNWTRLPGRHPKRQYVTSVWDGSCWQEGDRAVDLVLDVAGDNPDMIPRDRSMSPPPPLRRQYFAPTLDPEGRCRLAAAYLKKLPHLSEGQGRSTNAYTGACFLLRDLGLSVEEAYLLLEEWDQGNHPPLGETKLRGQMDCAGKYGRNPVRGGVA